jgi:hypothetical protein
VAIEFEKKRCGGMCVEWFAIFCSVVSRGTSMLVSFREPCLVSKDLED